jgi:hypothetical protein
MPCCTVVPSTPDPRSCQPHEHWRCCYLVNGQPSVCVAHSKRADDLRSRNASRYITARTGINRKSTLRRISFVSFGSDTGSCYGPSTLVHPQRQDHSQLKLVSSRWRTRSCWTPTSSIWSAELSSFSSSGYFLAIVLTLRRFGSQGVKAN